MKVVPCTFHPAAIEEAVAAAAWYRERSPVAAKRFIAELNRALDSIYNNPQQWPASARGVSKFKLRRFPFLIVDREAEGSF
jgi:plasmid stabilization system protein ParE